MALELSKKVILIADDDDDDIMFAKKAIKANCSKNELDIRIVKNGEELLEYLRGEGEFKDGENPKPSVIFLDIKMPKMDGLKALDIIKNDDDFKSIPVIILSSSGSEKDVDHGYNRGANSYIVKPSIYNELEIIMEKMKKFWFEAAELPKG